jgi:molybdopterin-guanine dinucleotide biosynthesis protein A
LLDVGGRRIVDRILAALRPLGLDEVLVLTNDEALADLPGVRLSYDPRPHAGVLPALAAGLAQASGDLCLAVAADMPFPSAALYRYEFEVCAATGADVVIPRTADFFQPMHAVYRRTTVRASIEAALARGEARLNSYFGNLHVVELQPPRWQRFSPDGAAFLNVNTPADLATAQALAQTHDAPESSV